MDNEVTVTIPDYILPVLKEAAEKKNKTIKEYIDLILNEWALITLMYELRINQNGRRGNTL